MSSSNFKSEFKRPEKLSGLNSHVPLPRSRNYANRRNPSIQKSHNTWVQTRLAWLWGDFKGARNRDGGSRHDLILKRWMTVLLFWQRWLQKGQKVPVTRQQIFCTQCASLPTTGVRKRVSCVSFWFSGLCPAKCQCWRTGLQNTTSTAARDLD